MLHLRIAIAFKYYVQRGGGGGGPLARLFPSVSQRDIRVIALATSDNLYGLIIFKNFRNIVAVDYKYYKP